MSSPTGALRAAAALGLLVLSLIPLVDRVGGDLAAPWYGPVARSWLVGTVGVALVGILFAVLARRAPSLWRSGAAGALLGRADPMSGRALALVAALAGAGYVAVALTVFDARPLQVDELVQTIMARSYAGGRVSDPSEPDPAFRSLLHLVDHDGRSFGHFPPGGPAWLAAGELIGMPWLAVPLAGALAVVGFGLVLRRLEPRASVRGGALLLFAFAPFAVFLAGSHMNHTPALMWALLGVAAVLRLGGSPAAAGPAAEGSPRPGRAAALAFGAGLAFGLLAVTRPPDGLAWLVAAGVWLLLRRRGLAVVGAALVGLILPLAGMLAINAATTGAPLRFAYEFVWGPGVGLGFHETPWGPAHTPIRGLALVNLYLLRLNVYLFETPMPALLPALAALALTRRLQPGDGLLLGASGLLLLVYFAYWHDGFYLGPRFVHGLLPVLALWTARLPGALRERAGDGWRFAERAVVYGGLAAALAAAASVPERVRQYAAGLQPMRWDADRAAEAAGIRNAVIFVQESWGSQLVARLWALGIPPAETERLYRNVDACRLEEAVTALESEGAAAGGPEARLERLRPLQADSARLVPSRLSPDRSERMLPGSVYRGRCVRRLQEDQAGMTLLAPHLLSRRADLWFGRNLHQRNRAVLERFPDRDLFLLTQPLQADRPEFRPLSRDSILTGSP